MERETNMLLFVLIALLFVFLFLFCFFPKPERPKLEKKRIACMGDSITFGAGVLLNRHNAWPHLLEKELGNSFQVINYGLSWGTLQMEGNLPYQRFGFIKRMENAKPDTVLFMLGTNDSKPCNWQAKRFHEQYEKTIYGMLQKGNSYQLVLMVPPRAFPNKITKKVLFGINDDLISQDIRNTILDIGDKYHLPVVDLYAFTKDHPEYFADGVHPNTFGNRAIAIFLNKTIF